MAKLDWSASSSNTSMYVVFVLHTTYVRTHMKFNLNLRELTFIEVLSLAWKEGRSSLPEAEDSIFEGNSKAVGN